MVCPATGFSQLKKLFLFNMPGLIKLWVDEGAMPNLSELTIGKCLMLKMLPQGLRYLTSLISLYITLMPVAFTKRITVIDGVEGKAFHKVCHISKVLVDR